MKPIMIGDCSACLHRNICKYKECAVNMKNEWETENFVINPFILHCNYFENEILNKNKK